jgi:hypothetical protein
MCGRSGPKTIRGDYTGAEPVQLDVIEGAELSSNKPLSPESSYGSGSIQGR